MCIKPDSVNEMRCSLVECGERVLAWVEETEGYFKGFVGEAAPRRSLYRLHIHYLSEHDYGIWGLTGFENLRVDLTLL